MQFSVTTWVIVLSLALGTSVFGDGGRRQAEEGHHHFKLAGQHVYAAVNFVAPLLRGEKKRREFRLHDHLGKQRPGVSAGEIEREFVVRMQSEGRRVDDKVMTCGIPSTESGVAVRKGRIDTIDQHFRLFRRTIVNRQSGNAAVGESESESCTGATGACHIDVASSDVMPGVSQSCDETAAVQQCPGEAAITLAAYGIHHPGTCAILIEDIAEFPGTRLMGRRHDEAVEIPYRL